MLFRNKKKINSKRLFPMSQKDLAEMLRMDCYEYSVIKWRLVSQEWPAMNSFWMRVNDLGMFSNYDRINLDSVILKNGENPRCQRGSERRSIIAQTDTSRATFMPLFIMNLDLYIYRFFIFPLLENKKKVALKRCTLKLANVIFAQWPADSVLYLFDETT